MIIVEHQSGITKTTTDLIELRALGAEIVTAHLISTGPGGSSATATLYGSIDGDITATDWQTLATIGLLPTTYRKLVHVPDDPATLCPGTFRYYAVKFTNWVGTLSVDLYLTGVGYETVNCPDIP